MGMVYNFIMKNLIKTSLANFTGKTAKKVIKLLKRRGTHTPGVVARKIDRNILKNIAKPQDIYVITGTNGKTTTTNLVADILEGMGIKSISNRIGSNTYAGIVTSLLDGNNYFGKNKIKHAVLEVDEQWCTVTLKDLHIKSLTITNLFQDSYERNANIFYIVERIEKGLPENIKLILNAEDSISAYIGKKNQRVYFSVDNIFNDHEQPDGKIKDLIYVPETDQRIIWDFNRYNHIGKYHSEDFTFKNPKAKYHVVGYNEVNNSLIVKEDGIIFEMPNIRKNIESVYNQIAAYATLRENGFKREDILQQMLKIKTVESRYISEHIGNKELISMVAKGYNPVANSCVLNEIINNPKTKTVIYLFDNLESKYLDSKSSAWAFSIDFKYLATVDRFIIRSRHYHEILLAVLMSGIDKSKIVRLDSLEAVTEYLDPHKQECIYILHDIERENLAQADKMYKIVKEYVGKI